MLHISDAGGFGCGRASSTTSSSRAEPQGNDAAHGVTDMGVPGNVFQRGPLEVTSRATTAGRVLVSGKAGGVHLSHVEVLP